MKKFSVKKLFTNCTGNTTIFTGKLTAFKKVVYSVRPHLSNTIANISFNYLSQTESSFRFHLNLEWYAVVNITRPSHFLHYTCCLGADCTVHLSQQPPSLRKVSAPQRMFVENVIDCYCQLLWFLRRNTNSVIILTVFSIVFLRVRDNNANTVNSA